MWTSRSKAGGPGETDQVGEVESVAETDSEGDGNVVCTTVYRAVTEARCGVGEHWQVPGGEKREGLYVKLRPRPRLALVCSREGTVWGICTRAVSAT